MGILDRVSTILRANINAMLDQAEDPEQTLDQIIRDMADAIGEARGTVAEMIAQDKALQADQERSADLAQQWQHKAETAMARNAEDLAKEALRRKIDYEKNAQTYATQLQAQHDVVAKLKHDLERLESKYDEAIRNREQLISRHRRAEAQTKIATAAAQLSMLDPSSELARMDERIRMEEARASAVTEVNDRGRIEDRIDALGADDELDRQLQDLRTKVKGQLPGGSAPTERAA